ncbi:MAG: DUF4387 domain-containing protein [Planctomycetota bacterium]|jgi:hypothetical protein
MTEAMLPEIAEVVRSKNAGPYELTLDIIFSRAEDYAFLKEKRFFDKALFAGLYGVDAEKVLRVTHFDPACAVKATLVRPRVSGQPGDADVYGAQQHAPLLTLRIPIPGAT